MDWLLILQTSGVALITAIAAVWIAGKRSDTADATDRSDFRKQLMEMVNSQQELLNECQKDHARAEMELQDLRGRIIHLEYILSKNGIQVIDI